MGEPNEDVADLLSNKQWGYPMTLKEGNVTYTKLFSEFVTAIKRRDDNTFQYPPNMAKFDSDAFIKKLVCDNPKHFLGL